MQRLLCFGCFTLIALLAATACAADANRLAYLDESDPYYVSTTFPKLVTPQWVGEPKVEAVVVLGIDDMRKPQPYEQFLRPILDRLKKIDGRAPVSIMTNQVDADAPLPQQWLKEGLSIEVHTWDHPCPCLQRGDLAAAQRTYEQCVDRVAAIPGNRPVAFRMPCCDSINSPSPRFFAEIFNKRTPEGNYLSLDSSVFNVITAADRELPPGLATDSQGQEIFRRYLPFPSYVNTIENYPYPYVIGRLCWEMPCVVPSDWSGQHVQQANNPRTLRDMQAALDATVIKRGTYNLVFHPHGWIRNEQIVALIDHVQKQHRGKVKFLNFREVNERLTENLLAGQPLRAANGQDNGVRVLDLNADGYLDIVIGNEQLRQTRLWSPVTGHWITSDFPVHLVEVDAGGGRRDAGVRFGVVDSDGQAIMLVRNDRVAGARRFRHARWIEDKQLLAGLETSGSPVFTCREGRDQGVRLRDLDGDARCELLVSNPAQQAVFTLAGGSWKPLPFKMPEAAFVVDAGGHDAGTRLVDIDEDGRLDLISSNERHFSLDLFDSIEKGWSRHVLAGRRGDAGALPMITRSGTNNGAWFKARHMWVQNEDTARLSDLVDRRSLDDLLKDILPGPKTPQASLQAIRLRPGFRAELAAAEPLVMDPIAIAWGPDAKLWVVEMGDYPLGVDGKGKPGGCVRLLEDADGDGRYDTSTVFLDNLGYPTGVAPWRNGVLVTCAPEIFYAEDTDGDGKADQRKPLFVGFGEGNQQHRVNGLKWGMDGWLYCANGDSGGAIKSVKTGERVDIRGHDFRIRPDQGLIQPESGTSQFGRNRDDWDNWFGCNNSDPMYHFVLPERWLRRNPHVPAFNSRVQVSVEPGPAIIYPQSRTITRFNDLNAANRFTSANSTMVYRDELFGAAFAGNTFVSEPVHNLVHREIMAPEQFSFTSQRADDEQRSEFLASSDNWFRPTMLQTGPDGALWVTDMYRLVIEHPEWIPKDWQKRLDLRAGHDMGRIYRVYPIDKTPRKIPRLDRLGTAKLVAALDSPSGWQRDMVQQMLAWRQDHDAVPLLQKLASTNRRAECRAQALCTLDLLGALKPGVLARALADSHPAVRRHAIRLSEPFLSASPTLALAVLRLSTDPDPQVQLQRAFSLGSWKDPRAGAALGQLALLHRGDRYMTTAIMSSLNAANLGDVLSVVLGGSSQPPAELAEQLLSLAVAFREPKVLNGALERFSASQQKDAAWRFTALAGLVEALDRRQMKLEKLGRHAATVARTIDEARHAALDPQAPAQARIRALRLLGRGVGKTMADADALEQLLAPQNSGELQLAAIEALARIDEPRVPSILLARWDSYGPAARSKVLDTLLARTAWVPALLDQLQRNPALAADLGASRSQRLLDLKDPALKSRAARLLAGQTDSDRQKVLRQHQAALKLTGDPQAGSAVFTKRCSVCHQMRGVGHLVGADLSALGDKPPEFFLEAILDPNRAVESKFVDYIARTEEGLIYTGMLANESGGSITLVGQEAKQRVILRSELESLKSTGKSLMPEGLEKDISDKDLADLIAYLRSTGPPRKKAPGNQPQVIKPAHDGSLELLATNCEIYGTQLTLELKFKNLGFWTSPSDRAVWTVEVPRDGAYSVKLNYACADSAAGNHYLLEVGDQSLWGMVATTGSWEIYRQRACGQLRLAAGKHQITLRSRGPITGALLDLGGIELRPAAQ